jgi:Secretion system C-terminal sorting domain
MWEQQAEGEADVTIVDMTGREAYHTTMELVAASGSASLDFSSVKNGVYLLKVHNDKVNFVGRIEIRH